MTTRPPVREAHSETLSSELGGLLRAENPAL
jgi:hypothetical protein